MDATLTARDRGTRRTPLHGARAVDVASRAARRRMLTPGERPAFLADWTDVLFVHFAVDPQVLRPHVPFELDTFRGRAYVSVVAFTQKRLRPRIGGRLAALASRPLAEHTFLNVRSYVRHGGERGIYFLAEWIPNRLACAVGPRMYGLPYRLARSDYRCDAAVTRRRFTGSVAARAGRLTWCARLCPAARGRPARRGLERFLLERYTAYTRRGDTRLRFRVWHEPWVRTPARVALGDTTLLRDAFPWLPIARPACAHFSDGVHDVWIGPPRRTDALTPSPGTPGEGTSEGLRTLLPPAVLLAAALATCGSLPPWAFMWAVCFALFFGCKWATWRRADARLRRDALRSIGYLFGWVGMDATAFLDPSRRATRGRPSEWAEAIVKTVAGAAVLWAGLRLVPPGRDLATGWLGMTGLVLLLHFGTFHLLSLSWRSVGVEAPAIMRSPARAASVAEFWGSRWNLGFHELATAFVFRPLRRPLGAAGATLATFIASGLVHELVISVPARGGYGLPTAYFAIQGAALLLERSNLGRGMGLGRRVTGRAFTDAAVALPLPWLFHPAFVRNAVLPLLEALGAA